MDDAHVSMEEEGVTLEDTNIELHPAYTFDNTEVEYMGVYIEEEDNVQPEEDDNVQPWIPNEELIGCKEPWHGAVVGVQ